MRKLVLFPAILLGTMVFFQSCSKQSSSAAVTPTSTNIIKVTIAPNESYQLPIESSGNTTASISKQASHFQVSRMEVDSKSELAVYKYKPTADYRGTDEVLLSKTVTSEVTGSGCSNNANHNTDGNNTTTSSTSYTTIKINITN